ncbi:helix-turn-helix domain-containing protein [Arthrobacter woluwensis]|uniref:helix-turn-helix domain-containing protein n=1 Tax=Arthrobacter woluwensis TaxID=156980 RepID=UPI000A73A8E8|nr:helix-turn-helix domain-containing protein [Arthrobacter woluwensis]
MRLTKNQSYPFEVKLEVVSRVLAGESKADLAAEFKIPGTVMIGKWLRQYRAEGEDGLGMKRRGRPPKDPDRPALSELEQLRHENAQLRAKVAYLGKLRALRGPNHG